MMMTLLVKELYLGKGRDDRVRTDDLFNVTEAL